MQFISRRDNIDKSHLLPSDARLTKQGNITGLTGVILNLVNIKQ